MIKQLVSTIADAVDGARACWFGREVNARDRLFTSSAFQQSAQWAKEQLAESGMVDAEVVQLPADGQTRMQDWTMPLAWECDEGELRLIQPAEKLLCRRQDEPRCIAMWSAPTDGQIRGPMQVLGEGETPQRGAFVLTDQHPMAVLAAAAEAGVAAIVSSWVVKGYADHRTTWCNSISTDGCWGLRAGQPTIPVFMIPPRVGQELRELADGGSNVELAGRIDGSVGAGTMPVTTARLAGRDHTQEVLVMAHGFESGANDNASGVAAVLEAARVLGQLIASGKLPAPRRSIRWFVTNECYGAVGLMTQRPDIARHCFVGLYLDTVGDASRADYPFKLHRIGAATPSVANGVAGLVLQSLPQDIADAYFWRYENELGLADHMITDPMIGIATPWIGRAQEFPAWHCSDDVPELLDETTMAASSILAAAYAYFLASAGDAEAAWLAEAMLPLLEEELQDRIDGDVPGSEAFWRWSLKQHLLKAADLAETEDGRQRVAAIADKWPADEFVPKGLEMDDPRAAELVPVRKTWGTLTFESLPPEERTFGSPRWNERYNGAWYWSDGKRTVAQIAELVQLEVGGKPQTKLLALFELAAKAGLCRLVEAKA